MTTYLDKSQARACGAACDTCPLRDQPFVPPTRPADGRQARFVILGESPGGREVIAQAPFVGPSGKKLDAIAGRHGLERGEALVCNAVACRPPKVMSDSKWTKALAACKPYRDALLAEAPAAPVLALGSYALTATTGKEGITAWYGYPLEGSGRRVLPALHPAFILREPVWQEELERSVERFGRIVDGSWRDWQPTGLVTESGWLEALRSMSPAERLTIDLETAGIDPQHDDILDFGIGNDRLAVSIPWPPPNEVRRELETLLAGPGKRTFHNAQHDISSMEGHNLPVPRWGDVEDTLLMDAAARPQLLHRLSVAAARLCRPRWKSEFYDESEYRSPADAIIKAKPEERRLYNALDVRNTHDLYPITEAELDSDGRAVYDELRALAPIAYSMRKRGLRADRVARQRHINRLTGLRQQAKEMWEAAAPTVNLGRNGMTAAVEEHFFDRLGCQVLQLTDGGHRSLNAWTLLRYSVGVGVGDPTATDLAKILLAYRGTAHLLGMIESLTISPDGYFHPAWAGGWAAVTGRWGCVAGDTLIQTSRGAIRIDSYEPRAGDTILTHTGNWCPLIAKIRLGVDRMYRVCLDTGESVTCTADHKFLTPQGWRPLRQLAHGSEVYCGRVENSAGGCEIAAEGDRGVLEQRGEAGHGRCGQNHTYDLAQCHGDSSTLGSGGAVADGEAPALLAQFDEVPAQASDRAAAPFVAWGSGGRRAWILDQSKWRGPTDIFAQGGDGGGAGGEKVTGDSGGAPYRRESAEQQSRQPGLVHSSRAQNFARQAQRVVEITDVGPMVVYDLQVDGDCSYLANGIISHNSGKPNIMNLPKGRPNAAGLVTNLRDMFTADDGCLFVAADLSQVEVRFTAILANEPAMLRAFEEKRDIHTENALDMFGYTDNKQEMKARRDIGKMVAHAFDYGAKAETAWMQAVKVFPRLQLELVTALRKAYFEKRPGLVPWHRRVNREAMLTGVVRAPLGHRREFFPDPNQVDPNKVYNFGPQAGVAKLVNDAMVRLHSQGYDLRWNAHDELGLCVPKADVISAAAALKEELERPVEMCGRLHSFPAEVSVGTSWGTLKPLEEYHALVK